MGYFAELEISIIFVKKYRIAAWSFTMNRHSHYYCSMHYNKLWERGLLHTVFCFNTAESADYSPVVSQPVTFPAGSAVGSRQCINIVIVNDGTNEANEQFSLSLAAGQNSAIGNPGAATVTIIDDDSKLVSLGSSQNSCSKPSCVDIAMTYVQLHQWYIPAKFGLWCTILLFHKGTKEPLNITLVCKVETLSHNFQSLSYGLLSYVLFLQWCWLDLLLHSSLAVRPHSLLLSA